MGTFTRWERAKQQSPESQGSVFVLSAGLPPFLPPALGITNSKEPNPLSCPWDFQRLNAPYPWSRSGQRRGQAGGKEMLDQYFPT